MVRHFAAVASRSSPPAIEVSLSPSPCVSTLAWSALPELAERGKNVFSAVVFQVGQRLRNEDQVHRETLTVVQCILSDCVENIGITVVTLVNK